MRVTVLKAMRRIGSPTTISFTIDWFINIDAYRPIMDIIGKKNLPITTTFLSFIQQAPHD